MHPLNCHSRCLCAECANSVVPAYLPIIDKRKNMPFTDHHKAWQQLRRGRYVEFNLVAKPKNHILVDILLMVLIGLIDHFSCVTIAGL